VNLKRIPGSFLRGKVMADIATLVWRELRMSMEESNRNRTV
jgi:hypothetical protein